MRNPLLISYLLSLHPFAPSNPPPSWKQTPVRMKHRLPASPEFNPTVHSLIESWTLSCSRRSFRTFNPQFHSGWRSTNPSVRCDCGTTRLPPVTTGSIGDAQHQFVPHQHPAAAPPARRTHSPPRAGRIWPAGIGTRCDLLRRQTAVALAGLAAAAEGLQVAEVACASVVPGHDGVHLQGPLVRGLPSNSLPRSTRSGSWRIGEPGP